MVPITTDIYWTVIETGTHPPGVTRKYTFRGEPNEKIVRAKVAGYEGFGPDGQPRTVSRLGAHSTFELTSMGESEPPKYAMGQTVTFGQRGPRMITQIRLTARGWEYYVPLIVAAHGTNRYATWRGEKQITPTSS